MADSPSRSPGGGGATGLGSVLKSLAKPFKSAAIGGTSNATPQIKPTVLGTAHGIDLNELLGKLSPNNSNGSRVAASELIRSSVEVSSVSSIPEIWYQAREMINSKQMVECRRAGMRLLNACITHDEHVAGARLVYYKDIIMHSNLEEFDLQLIALKTLTKDGRDMSDLYQSGYPFPAVLCSWLRRLANETQEIRIGRKPDIAMPWSRMEENFHNLLNYIKNCLKFNITAFDEDDLSAILKETVGICRKTSQQIDISVCCDLIDTVMVFGYLPLNSLCDILEVLCGITITVEQQADQAWNTVYNLAKSHVGNNTIMLLCKILEGSHQTEVNSNTMRGAARFLLRLIEISVGPQSKEIVAVPIFQILPSFRLSLKVESVRHGLEVCNCLYKILSSDDIRKSIPYEVWESDLSSPLEALYIFSQSPLLQRRSRQSLSKPQNAAGGGPGSVYESIASTSDDVIGAIIEKFDQIATLVSKLLENRRDFNGPYEMLITFLLDMSAFINDDCAMMVINCFEVDHYCNPLSKNWADNLDTLVSHFWDDHTWSTPVRSRVIRLARDMYTISRDICEIDVIAKLTDRMFGNITYEEDLDALNELLELFVLIAVECDLKSFSNLCDLLTKVFARDESESPHLVSVSVSQRTQLVARSLAHMFVLTFRYSPTKAKRTYFYLVTCCQKCLYTDPIAFLEAARLLCRIRVTTSNNIYLTAPNNMDGLAASMGRSYSTGNKTGKEAWWYPEQLAYLGADNLEIPSTMLKRGNKSITEMREIDIGLWLKVIVNVLEHGAPWEAYSFVLSHLAPQLSNIQLFCECTEEILKLRHLMCEQISAGRIPSVDFPKDISRLDAMVALTRSMSSLIGYNAMVFTKRDTDYIVQAFVLGLSSWEKTAVPCIHGLVVCCYEFPLSIKKFMFQIFNKLQTKITTTTSSPHVLEFLLSLSRLPSLTDNFTQDEYRRVFGMAFKYIQHASDLAHQPNSVGSDQSAYMSQYLLALAYNVVANWFLTLKVSNRKNMATFITRNLILANGSQNDIDDQSLATLDLISRFTHSDLDLVMQHTNAPVAKGAECKRWIYGTGIITLESHLETGSTKMVVRRPTGTTVFNIRPDEKTVPQHLKEKVLLMHENEEETLNTEPGLRLFSPSYMLLQMVLPSHPDFNLKPTALFDDAATNRALGAFDRTPVVDFHKVGVMYIAPGQCSEQEILANATGSRAYRRFLSRLGSLIRLKGNKQVYTGGLDTENDIDGEYAYAWNDKITQVIYHTTTLMPLQEHDKAFAGKKRHIGNNYVSIFYDESGLPFDFDVVKSQFNFINIVVSPHTVTFRQSSGMADETQSAQTKNYYRVRAYRREGVPAVFAACHLKTVSEEALPLFVRNLALIASKFATVWHSEGQYISNWRYRLQQIRQLQDRTTAQLKEEEDQRKNNNASERGGLGSNSNSSSASTGGPMLGNGGAGNNSSSNLGSLAGQANGSEGDGMPDFDAEDDASLPLLKKLAFSSFT